jgi:hypothetical protein
VAKFPEPPPPTILASLGAAIRVIPPGTQVWRIYFQGGAHPTTWGQFRAWGPTDARFDHHLPPPSFQRREILYGALGPHAAVTTLAEVFQASRVVERTRRSPAWVAFALAEEIRLLDLTGTWPTRAGASMAITSGVRPRGRRWSQAIYAAFPAVSGLFYGSSMNANEPCVALFERAMPAVPPSPTFHRQLSDPAVLTLLKNACAGLDYVLV